MDKKPLIVISISAVILLLLGSLSNVIGYQSVKLMTVNNSPLFTTRTQKANNQQHNIITSDFLGKERETNLYFPKRDSEKEFIDKVINIFKEIDDKSFDEFVNRFILSFRQNNFDNLKTSDKEIKDILYQMKSNPDALQNYYLIINEKGRLERTFQEICIVLIILMMFLMPVIFLWTTLLQILEFFRLIINNWSIKICSPWHSMRICQA